MTHCPVCPERVMPSCCLVGGQEVERRHPACHGRHQGPHSHWMGSCPPHPFLGQPDQGEMILQAAQRLGRRFLLGPTWADAPRVSPPPQGRGLTLDPHPGMPAPPRYIDSGLPPGVPAPPRGACSSLGQGPDSGCPPGVPAPPQGRGLTLDPRPGMPAPLRDMDSVLPPGQGPDSGYPPIASSSPSRTMG